MKNKDFFINDPDDNNEIDYAYLNFRLDGYDKGQQFIEMSKGYLDTAKILLTSLAHDNINKRADIEIFPTLFLLNHGLELLIKSLFFYSNLTMIKTHNLKSLIDSLIKEKPNFTNYLKHVKSYINILNKYKIFSISKNLDITRYSHNSNDKPFPYAQSFIQNNFKISISILLEHVDKIHDDFYELYDLLDERPNFFK